MGIQINGQTDTVTSTTSGGSVKVTPATINATGLSTFSGGLLVGTGASISSPATNTLALGTNNTEAVRINSVGNIGIGTTNALTKFHICYSNAGDGSGGALTLDDVNRNGVIYTPGQGASQGIYYFRRGTPSSYTDQLIIDNNGNLKFGTAGTKVLNSSGNPILQQTGSVLQVAWKNLGSGSFTATSTSSTYRATGFTNTITPTATSSKILHIVTIGVQFICDGNLTIARGGTVASPSLMDSYRDGITLSYINDLPAFTFTWLDTTGSSSAISYELFCRATGCGGLMFVGSSSDFDSSWTLMEIAG